jgi:hypothetical protein
VLEQLVLRPLADAFLQVGVAVAVLVAAVAWAQVRYGTRALDVLVRHSRAAPALGALLGVLPGCGGAVLAAGLYLKRRASYGTAVAALTATMGDASFVLLAVDLRAGLVVHAVLLLTGLVTGYAVDALALDPRRDRALVGAAPRPSGGAFSTPRDGAVCTRAPDGSPVVGLPLAAAVLWLVVAAGSVLAVPAALGLLDPLALAAATGGVDLWLVVGVGGFLACATVFVRAGCRLRDDGDEPPVTVAEGLAHGAVETAFVVFWVSVAFVAMAVLGAVTPLDGDVLPLAGLVGVVVGVLVALVPGCGTQIAFTGLYATGVLPLPALLANAVAQDGDALLPMLAQDRRSAVVTTALTSVPALVVGVLALVVL